jgi:hypothetical protein
MAERTLADDFNDSLREASNEDLRGKVERLAGRAAESRELAEEILRLPTPSARRSPP